MVNVTGDITGSCSITAGATPTIDLGSIPVSTFTGVGTTSPISAAQNIVLTCTSSPGVKMRMTCAQAAGAPITVLALTARADAASGVGVQLLYDGTSAPKNPLALGTDVVVTASAGTTVTIPVAARYYATAASPNAGIANSTATLSFTFN